MPEKKYLFTPGPTPVPPQVLAALAEPVVHHRSPDFRPTYERCLERLRTVCRTQNDVLLFTASGTGAFESAVANLVSPGEEHLVVSAGSFGERWAAMVGGFARTWFGTGEEFELETAVDQLTRLWANAIRLDEPK